MADIGVQPRTIARTNRFATTLAALSYRNYRLWFVGQLTSLVGTWMESTAQGFLIYQLTGSPVYLGLVGFAAGVPSWFLMLFGGVVADRIPRRTLLVATQAALMMCSVISATLTFTGLIQPWHLLVLALAVGTANAFDAPARQSFVLEMVEREHLGNAIALNSTMFQMATVVGPAVAGLTYAAVGPAWCFTINAISFLAVIAALLLMKIEKTGVKIRNVSAIADLKEGLRYVYGHSLIRTLILVAVVISFFGFSYITLLPAWAVTILGGDATTNGLLQSARGLGALLGAGMIVSLGQFRGKGKLLTLGSFVFPFGLIAFALVNNTPLALLLLVVIGWGFMVLFNMLNTLVQTLVDDQLRGRVMSIYTLSFFGGMPLGALWTGTLAEKLNQPITVIIGALISLGFAVFIFWRIPKIRALT